MWFSDLDLMRTTAHCQGNIHRTDNVLGLSTGRGPFPSVLTQQPGSGWGTRSIPGEKLSPIINTHENNSSLGRGLESAALA